MPLVECVVVRDGDDVDAVVFDYLRGVGSESEIRTGLRIIRVWHDWTLEIGYHAVEIAFEEVCSGARRWMSFCKGVILVVIFIHEGADVTTEHDVAEEEKFDVFGLRA